MPHLFGFKKKMWEQQYAVLLIGRKRSGKSTILSMVAQEAIKQGYTVYSNYPIDGTFAIPKKVTSDGKHITDKSFFYDNPMLENSIVLLDEVSNIWNARSWGRWTEDDADFFNYLGKNNTRVFMAVQYYDMVDLNVKRNVDATWFVDRSIWPNTSIVEVDINDVRKVADTQSRVLDSKFQRITFEVCVIPDGRYYFRRRKYYKYFLTKWKDIREPKDFKLDSWHDLCFND